MCLPEVAAQRRQGCSMGRSEMKVERGEREGVPSGELVKYSISSISVVICQRISEETISEY